MSNKQSYQKPTPIAETEQPVVALMQAGNAIIRAENEAQATIAIQRPREEQKVLDGALRELEMAPEYAARSFYVIPYRNAEGGTTNVEGPSIKAALALVRRWGNCAAGARVIEETDESATVEGVFLDHESNVRLTRQLKVSRFYKARGGGMNRLDDGRFAMAINSAGSKALRNAILSSLPAYLVDSYYDKAKQLAANPKGSKREARIQKMVDSFDGLGIPVKIVVDYLKHPLEKITDDELGSLVGIYNALKDGQTTIDEAFGFIPKESSEPAVTGSPSVAQAKQGKLVS